MPQVNMLEAKTKLSKLVEAVETARRRRSSSPATAARGVSCR